MIREKLTLRHQVDASGGPGALCTNPAGTLLFASIRSVGTLASFRINDDGSLIKLSEVAAGADPAYVATDPAGKFLLSALLSCRQSDGARNRCGRKT